MKNGPDGVTIEADLSNREENLMLHLSIKFNLVIQARLRRIATLSYWCFRQ